ncbi:MAG TPA: cell division protein FtsQ [Opitutaceae bacterium]
MSKLDSATPVARNWRDIPQTVAPRAMSTEGRRRLAFSTGKLIATCALSAAALWGGFEIWRTWETAPQTLTAAGKGEPVKTIELRTDGVLDLSWVNDVLALPRNVALMELDLPGLQSRLTTTGQVRTAVLVRKFPSTLVVTLQERSPVVRIRPEAGPDLVVARDGTVYAGTGYADDLITSLPWLAGVRLTRAGDGYVPLTGLETLAELLTVTQANAPGLYRSWNVVDLSRLPTDGEIIVRSKDIPEVVFGTRDDFFTQVALLDSTIEQIALNPALGQPSRVNLAVGGRQVPVAFGGTPAPTRAPEPAKQNPTFFRPIRPISLE